MAADFARFSVRSDIGFVKPERACIGQGLLMSEPHHKQMVSSRPINGLRTFHTIPRHDWSQNGLNFALKRADDNGCAFGICREGQLSMGSGKAQGDSGMDIDAVQAGDFRERMTRLLEDLDAAGEKLAAVHVETALSKLSK